MDEQTGSLERMRVWGRAVSPAAQAPVGIPRRPHGRSPWGSPHPVRSEEEDLVEAGIAALEAGDDEAAAYTLFEGATSADPHDLRAWFWRAKTAETLDEVVECLQRALELDPKNSQIKANLDWAMERREQARLRRTKNTQPGAAETAARAFAPRPPRARERLRGVGLEVTRCLTAVAVLGIGVAWLLSALPPDVRQALTTAVLPSGGGML